MKRNRFLFGMIVEACGTLPSRRFLPLGVFAEGRSLFRLIDDAGEAL